MLISGASDATVRVWDVHKLPTGELVKYGGAAGDKKDKKIKMGGGGGKSDKEVEASCVSFSLFSSELTREGMIS